jgi:hypothetical protein
VNNALDVKENDEHALDFALHLSCLFQSWRFSTFCVQLMLPSPTACLIIARVSMTLFLRFAQNLMLIPLLDPSQNRIRRVTRLQTKKM